MSDYTMEELQKMMDEKVEEEVSASMVETTEQSLKRQIVDANDNVQYVLRDSSKFNKIVYSYEQSATVGKRITSWFKYKPFVEDGVIKTYARTSISESFSTNLNETYSQTGLIIED